jgi:hypothetical protein
MTYQEKARTVVVCSLLAVLAIVGVFPRLVVGLLPVAVAKHDFQPDVQNVVPATTAKADLERASRSRVVPPRCAEVEASEDPAAPRARFFAGTDLEETTPPVRHEPPPFSGVDRAALPLPPPNLDELPPLPPDGPRPPLPPPVGDETR